MPFAFCRLLVVPFGAFCCLFVAFLLPFCGIFVALVVACLLVVLLSSCCAICFVTVVFACVFSVVLAFRGGPGRSLHWRLAGVLGARGRIRGAPRPTRKTAELPALARWGDIPAARLTHAYKYACPPSSVYARCGFIAEEQNTHQKITIFVLSFFCRGGLFVSSGFRA